MDKKTTTVSAIRATNGLANHRSMVMLRAASAE
jgi:hypothetical protein